MGKKRRAQLHARKLGLTTSSAATPPDAASTMSEPTTGGAEPPVVGIKQCTTLGCSFFGRMCSGCARGNTPAAIAAVHARAEAEAEAQFVEQTWVESGLTFSAAEFAMLVPMMRKLAIGMSAALELRTVAEALLETGRLLTPHQARELYALLKCAVKRVEATDDAPAQT